MKYLQTLCEQANVPLTLKYYYPYLNALEENILQEAVRKQSPLYALQLLKAISLQILFLLQNSACLWGESYWQLLLNKKQSELISHNRSDNIQLKMALLRADEVISTASVTEIVRKKVWREVKSHTILSDSQAERYESIRQECLARQTALHELESSVNTTLHDYHQLIEHSPLLNQGIPSSRYHLPESSCPLRSYDVKMVQARLSKENVHHQIQCEGDARIVYQSLARELAQKPVAEKMAEEVQKVKNCLQNSTEQIAEKTDHYQRKILRQAQFAIEHRTQVTMAHASRIENISLSLAAVIQSVQSHSYSPCQSLLSLMAGAQAMQKDIQKGEYGTVLHEKLLTLNAYRCTYEKSITSFWGTLFTNHRQLYHQQQLNHNLQTELSRLVTSVCGLNDKNKVVSPEIVQKLRIISDKLLHQRKCLSQELDKISQAEKLISL